MNTNPTDQLLATVREDMRRAKVTAVRMLLITVVGSVITLVASQGSDVAFILAALALLFAATSALFFVLLVLKLLFGRRSVFKIYEDGFVWEILPSFLRHVAIVRGNWNEVETYRHVVQVDRSRLLDGPQPRAKPDVLAGAFILSLIWSRLPPRHSLHIGLRNGKKIRLSELSGDVHLLDEVVHQINPGTIYRLGKGNFKFQAAHRKGSRGVAPVLASAPTSGTGTGGNCGG